MSYFDHIPPIQLARGDDPHALAFRHYDPARLVLGKRMDEHLRLAVCYWHSFVWPGVDMFGAGTFHRPWHGSGDPMKLAHLKADAAFDFFRRLGAPFYTFHDTDIAEEKKNCLDSENAIRDELVKEWSSFAPADKTACTNESRMGGDSSYTELLTCLEMARDVRTMRTEQASPAAPSNSVPPNSAPPGHAQPKP